MKTRTVTPATGNGILPRLPLYLFLLTLALAPLLGGTPAGSEYALAAWGGDAQAGVLRVLVLASALLALTLGDDAPVKPTVLTRVARFGVYGAALWVAASLFFHTRLFTDSVYLFAMLPETLNWVVFAATFALAGRFAAQNKRALPQMATALLIGGVVCAVVGVLAFGAVPGAERAAHREGATFFSPNFAGGLAALLLPVAVALFLAAEGLIPVVLTGAATGLTFALLMLTGSRASLGLAVLGLIVALTLGLIRKAALPWKRIAASVALLAVFGAVFGAPMRGRVAGVQAAQKAETSDHSGDFRVETWRGTLAMATANPVFGTAPGTFPYTYPRYARVAWTGHAHSSYLQIAGESGFPALFALLVGIGATLLIGLKSGYGTQSLKGDAAHPLLLPALIGGTIAALGRNAFDSEWILLASGIAFFAVLGMIVGSVETGSETANPPRLTPRLLGAAFFAATVILAFLVRAGQSERDTLTVLNAQRPGSVAAQAREAAARVRPADPQLYALGGDYAMAAYFSPSGKRFFQLARDFERRGDYAKAVETYEKSVDADPNNLQTGKALAEAQTKIGDGAGAISTYLDMIKTAEGVAGKIRALPELTDTLPAFAYTAVAEDALKRGDTSAAEQNFRTAQSIVEAYSQTTPTYQMAEVATLGANTASRRAEVRDLYTERILPGRRAAIKKAGQTPGADVSAETEATTLTRLDAFAVSGQ